jgi:serine-type D-Ala-D-Ala carboxypeptidase/endopeptidase
VLLALSALLAQGPGAAQAAPSKQAIGTAGNSMFRNSQARGMVLAVVRDDQVYVKGYGETAPDNNKQPDGKSIFRLASISKVFTAQIFADMVADGKIGLTDPLDKYAPPAVTIKRMKGMPITLFDLATHGAGLPRECIDPAVAAANDGKSNPFDVCNKNYYWTWLSQNEPSDKPGTTTMYSNMGYGLLGEALTSAAGKSFRQLLEERITTPLDMPDTVLKLTEEQKSRLMIGINDSGQVDPDWPTPPIMDASGGIYSSGDDMVHWMCGQLARPLSASLAMQHAMWKAHDGQNRLVGVRSESTDGMGLGWVVSGAHDHIPFLLSKSGAIGGFMSYIVIAPNRKLGIFVVVNRVNYAMLDQIQKDVGALAAELCTSESHAESEYKESRK